MSRPKLSIFSFGNLVQIKRGRKSVELLTLDEADQLGHDLICCVAAIRATQPAKPLESNSFTWNTRSKH